MLSKRTVGPESKFICEGKVESNSFPKRHVDGHLPCQDTDITASIPEPRFQASGRVRHEYCYDPIDSPRLSPAFDNDPPDHRYVRREGYYDGSNSPRQRYRRSLDGNSAYRANSSRRRNPPTRSRPASPARPRQTPLAPPPPSAGHRSVQTASLTTKKKCWARLTNHNSRFWNRLRTIFDNRPREDKGSLGRPSTSPSQRSPAPRTSYDRYHDRSPRSRYTATLPEYEDNNPFEPLHVHHVQRMASSSVPGYGGRASPLRHTHSYEAEIQEHLRTNDLRGHGPFRYWGGVPRMRFDDYAWTHGDHGHEGPTSEGSGQDRWLDWDWQTAEYNRGRRSAEMFYSDNSPPVSLPPPPIGMHRHTRWESSCEDEVPGIYTGRR